MKVPQEQKNAKINVSINTFCSDHDQLIINYKSVTSKCLCALNGVPLAKIGSQGGILAPWILESHIHVLRVVQLFQIGQASKLDHGRGPTHQDLGGRPRGRKVLLDHVTIDEPRAVRPT